MKKLFLLLSLCCISFAAWADEYTDENGVKWEYWTSSNWDETTQENIYYASINGISSYGSEVVVPSVITVGETNYEVQQIEQGVFYGKPDISSVTLPSTLKSISSCAFQSCSSLTTINIPEGVTDIYYRAFSDCSSLTSITIPNSVTSIGDCAFESCNALTNVTIPNGITKIGEGIFRWCI